MRRGRSACASLRSMLMNGVMPMPPAIITMARSGSSCRLIVPVGPTIRTRAGRSGRERLFVGALAHAGGDRQPVLVGRGCEREAALAVVARAWKVLRQKEVYRFTRLEREPARLFEMEGARSFGDLLAAHQLAVIFAFDACHDVSPLGEPRHRRVPRPDRAVKAHRSPAYSREWRSATWSSARMNR